VATNPANRIVTFDNPDAPAVPFGVSSSIILQDVNPRYYDGNYTVIASTDTTVEIACTVVQPFVSGAIAPLYTWNYNPNWSSVYAKFMRLYNTPNVGSILVAGNLTATNIDTTTEIYPVTVQWSQAFGLNEAPTTWTPTVTNVANQLEVPLRGPALDAFPSNGQFFLCSYWDTVVFSPINYSTTSAPILGVRQYNQGRGLLSSNCWANTDKLVYGLDARDIWTFDGQYILRRCCTIGKRGTSTYKVTILNKDVLGQTNKIFSFNTFLRSDNNLSVTTFDSTETYYTIYFRDNCRVSWVSCFKEFSYTWKTTRNVS
jgi:hypothetical protein